MRNLVLNEGTSTNRYKSKNKSYTTKKNEIIQDNLCGVNKPYGISDNRIKLSKFIFLLDKVPHEFIDLMTKNSPGFLNKSKDSRKKMSYETKRKFEDMKHIVEGYFK